MSRMTRKTGTRLVQMIIRSPDKQWSAKTAQIIWVTDPTTIPPPIQELQTTKKPSTINLPRNNSKQPVSNQTTFSTKTSHSITTTTATIERILTIHTHRESRSHPSAIANLGLKSRLWTRILAVEAISKHQSLASRGLCKMATLTVVIKTSITMIIHSIG